MQQNSLVTFQKQIQNIEKYIVHIELVNNITAGNKYLNGEFLQKFNHHFISFERQKNKFEYKSIIISLYGILENTITEWIMEHIKNVSLIVKDYNNLEDKFKIRHFDLSIKLISLISENRYSKYENIDKEDILKRLNKIIVKADDFELNSEAYIPFSGNLTHSKIIEGFKPLDIDLNSLKDTLNLEIIKIDDLVSRRNEIAHGSEIDNWLGTTEFQSYIDALKKYMITLFSLLSIKEIEYKVKHHKLIYIDKPKEFFCKNTVCIINIEDIELKVGDMLFIEKNRKFSEVTIMNIEKDDIKIQSASDGELGLKLNIPIQKNSKIWKLGLSI